MPPQLFLQYLVSGVIYGSIYAAVAIGFNIIYNATGIINFAQGEFAMLGGMIASSLAGRMPLALAIAAAVALTALFGAGLERVFLRRVARGGVLKMIVTTIGLSILIREAALLVWGESVRTLPFFSGNEVSSVSFLGANFSPQVFWVVGVTALVVAGLTAFFRFTMMGKAMRGCSANRDGASLCGIDPRRMVTIAFALSAGIGAVAGCLVAPLTQTHYAIGMGLAIKGFTVAAFGGLGNSVAAVVAGLFLGMLESFSIIAVPEAYKDVVSICVLLAVLFVKPSGLFGSRAAGALKDY
jgi:branched-chain amino acid transport system permease protein